MNKQNATAYQHQLQGLRAALLAPIAVEHSRAP
jgi:hypothetical protein